jgi:hypothetical protein
MTRKLARTELNSAWLRGNQNVSGMEAVNRLLASPAALDNS